MEATSNPDRVWIGRLDPVSRAAVLEALGRLGWPSREVPCEDTALSLTPEGAVGILVRSVPGRDRPGAGGRLPTLWAVRRGAPIPRIDGDPPADFFRAGAPAEEIEARLRLLVLRSATRADLDRLRAGIESERRRGREIAPAIAGDLGRLLAALSGSLASLEESIPAAGARAAAARLAERIEEIADLGRFEAGEPIPVDLRPVELGPLIEGCRGKLAGTMTRGRTIRLLLPEPLPPACGDPRRIEQILRHLIREAERHCLEDGVIPIRAERDPDLAGSLLLLVGCAAEPRSERFSGPALVEAIAQGVGGETVRLPRGRGGSWFGIRLPIWRSRAGRIAEAQAALAAAGGPEGGMAVWRVSGPAAAHCADASPIWRSLGPEEHLAVGEAAPPHGIRLGRVLDLRRPRGIETALAPRLRFDRVGARPAQRPA